LKQKRRKVQLETMNSQGKAARLEQVSTQKNNVLASHTVQMHTLVIPSGV